MQLPSVSLLLKSAGSTLLRFPFVLVSAIIGTAAAIWQIELPYDERDQYEFLTNIIMTCSLGLTLFLSAKLYSERKQFSVPVTMVIQVFGVILLAFYYSSLPDKLTLISGIRYSLFTIGLHLLVSFAPYIGKAELNGFWQYNKMLFIRILTALLYSGVLYLGLALAIAAIDNLFEVEIDGKIYGQLWVFIAGLFNTWFFLAGVSKDFDRLQQSDTYPKGLKIFTQYVLIPLVTVYLLILYAYTFKILFDWDWPRGWVAYLVIGFSTFGILALLLIYPIQDKKENNWIRTFSRWFYFALFPLIMLLLLAIWRRISEYGITENRYFVLVLAVWLTGIAIYFLVRKMKMIILIPVSLCIIAFLSSFGPWSAVNISKHSQISRFKAVLIENDMLENGLIKKTSKQLSFKHEKQISSIIDYFDERGGIDYLQPFFSQNFDSLFVDDTLNRYRYDKTGKLLDIIGLEYISRWHTEEQDQKYYYFTASEDMKLFNIKGYDYMLRLRYYGNFYGDDDDSLFTEYYEVDDEKLIISVSKDTLELKIVLNDELIYVINLNPLINKLKNNYSNDQYNIPANVMTLYTENDRYKVKMFFKSIYLQRIKDDLVLYQIQADVLIGK